MSLEEVLRSKSIGEAELKVLSANMHLLTDEQLIKYGFLEKKEELPKVAKKAKKN